jgi:hypothetical protein
MISTPTAYTSPPLSVAFKGTFASIIADKYDFQIKATASILFYFFSFPKKKLCDYFLLPQRQSYLSWKSQVTLGAGVT